MMTDSTNGEVFLLDDNEERFYNSSNLIDIPQITPTDLNGGCFGSGPGAINVTEGALLLDTFSNLNFLNFNACAIVQCCKSIYPREVWQKRQCSWEKKPKPTTTARSAEFVEEGEWEVVVHRTDNGGDLARNTPASYIETMKRHFDSDPNLSLEDHAKLEAELNACTIQFARVLRVGAKWGHWTRVKSAVTSHFGPIPLLSGYP